MKGIVVKMEDYIRDRGRPGYCNLEIAIYYKDKPYRCVCHLKKGHKEDHRIRIRFENK